MFWIVLACTAFWTVLTWLASHNLLFTGLVCVVALLGCTLACALASVSAEHEEPPRGRAGSEDRLTVVRW